MAQRGYKSACESLSAERKLPTTNCVPLLVLIACTVLPPVSLAQSQTTGPPQSDVSPSTQLAKPEFEVVSIRPSDPNMIYRTNTPSLNIGGDRYVRFVRISLRDLIMLAYGIGASQVQGPSFLNGTPEEPADRFDVAAKTPTDATPGQVPLMLQAMLAERFHLTFHRASKQLNIYALEVAKGGLKMKESAEGDGEARCARTQVGNPDFVASHEGASIAAVCSGMTSADIGRQVQVLAPAYFSDGPVVDLSGLRGRYDFKIEWISIYEANNGSPGPTIMEAIQQQLGLKIERRRQAMEVLVMDKLDRTPTEN